MKRMWVILSLFLLALVWAVTSIAQKATSSGSADEPFDRLKRRMELREEMHRRMRDKILHGRGSDTDIFEGMDQMFEEAFKDMDSFSSFAPQSSNFESQWTENSQGRTLVITPKDKDAQLNIDVNSETITIKGKIEKRSETGTLMSNFNNVLPVPQDCDGSKVKMNHKDGKILVELPFKMAKAPKSIKPTTPPKEERKPLPPSEDDITI
jgi:HSP20 family molecular chaperone IbpA